MIAVATAAVASLFLSQLTPAPAAKPAAPICSATDQSAPCHHPEGFEPKVPTAAPTTRASGLIARGAKLSGKNVVTLEQLLANPAAQAGKTVTVEGSVRQACTRKGCWMELAPKAAGAGVRVTFKDYAFFVPTDSAGSTARVEGVVEVAHLSEERAAHYASEGATVPHGKDGKPEEVQIVASGVELRR